MEMQLQSDVRHAQLRMLLTQHKAFEPKDQDSNQQLVDPDTGIGARGQQNLSQNTGYKRTQPQGQSCIDKYHIKGL
jgi:hypothetical protein